MDGFWAFIVAVVLVLGVLLGYIFTTVSVREADCQSRGGVYADSVCLDRSAVIKDYR